MFHSIYIGLFSWPNGSVVCVEYDSSCEKTNSMEMAKAIDCPEIPACK